MRKRTIATAVVLFLILGACADDATTTTSLLAVTTSITQGPSTTARQQIVDGGLVPVDPATLVPVPGAESLLIADSFWGVVSPNRRFAGIEAWQSADERTPMNIVDLDTLKILSSSETAFGAGALTITDDGTAYWYVGGNDMQLARLSPGADSTEIVFDDSPEGFFYVGEFKILGPETFGIFGVTSIDRSYGGEASILIIDIGGDSQTQISLPNVEAGILEEGEVIDDQPSLVIADPVAVWDPDQDRVFIVEATRDVITEVNLATGEISEHRWTRPEAFLDKLWAFFIPVARAKGLTAGTTRDAVLSSDGRLLYVATRSTEIEEGDEIASPLDLIVIDTETWGAAAIDANVDTLYPSPDRTFLLAQGVEVISGETGVQASPVYVIDMATGELLIGFQTSDISATDVSFSSDSALAYLTTRSDQEMKIDILDLGRLQLTGAIEFRELSLIGEAGLMAFHFDQ